MGLVGSEMCIRDRDKPHLIAIFQRVMPLLDQEPVVHHLWIIEETRIRIRGEEG